MRAHFAALPASLIAALMRKPVVQEINGKPQDVLVTYPGLSRLGALLRWAYRAQMRCAAHVIVVTEGLRTWAREQARNAPVSVIGNGANVRLFTPEGETAGIEVAYVVFVGGLVAWHGIETMLAALDQPDWPQDVHLVAIGDGVERVRFEAASGHPRLRWLGLQPYQTIPSYLRGAVAALCVINDPDGRSSTGVAPLKLYEAMACGAAVIVSDLPSQADLVRREAAGLVVPMADPGALARAVAALAAVRAGAREMGSRGAAYVRAHASWQTRADETGLILQGLTGNR
jgi:glycosyltransferase involved in cell wall biosynthesis